MRVMIERFLTAYGAPTLLLRQDGKMFGLRALIQPRKSLSQRNAIKRITPLGEILGDTYLFICSVDCGAGVGDTLKNSDGTFYELRQVEKVMYKKEPIYLWGLCVQKGGAESWDSQS